MRSAQKLRISCRRGASCFRSRARHPRPAYPIGAPDKRDAAFRRKAGPFCELHDRRSAAAGRCSRSAGLAIPLMQGEWRRAIAPPTCRREGGCRARIQFFTCQRPIGGCRDPGHLSHQSAEGGAAQQLPFPGGENERERSAFIALLAATSKSGGRAAPAEPAQGAQAPAPTRRNRRHRRRRQQSLDQTMWRGNAIHFAQKSRKAAWFSSGLGAQPEKGQSAFWLRRKAKLFM